MKKAALIILFLTSYLFPQDSTAIYSLDSVVVTVTGVPAPDKFPYSLSILTSRNIQTGKTGISLSEISNFTPGLIVNNRNNFSLGDKIIIRGIGARSSFGVRGIKILYDDIPLTMPDGQSQLNNLDLYSTGAIEVIKGPASFLYGNSSGGVISIYSEGPVTKNFSVFPQIFAGSYGLTKFSLKATGVLGYHNYLFNINKFNYGGFRDHSDASSFNINTAVTSSLSTGYLRTVLNYYNSPYLLNPGSLTKEDAENNPEMARQIIKQQGAGEKLSHIQAGATFVHTIYDYFRLDASVYYVGRSTLNPIPGRIIDLKRSAGGLRTSAEYRFYRRLIAVTAGADFGFQSDDRKEYINNGLSDPGIAAEDIFDNLSYGNTLLNQKEKVFNASPFIHMRADITRDLFLSAALRYDYYEFQADDFYREDGIDDSGLRVMRNLSPAAGLTYSVARVIKLYANFSTSFQTPTTNELSNDPGGAGGFNKTLEPEHVYSYEAGGILYIGKFTFSAAAYFMKFTGMLVSYQLESAAEETYFRNSGESQNTGVEMSAEYKPASGITFTANYAFNNFKFSDYKPDGITQLKGKYVPGVPVHKISFMGGYSDDHVYARIDGSYTGSYYANDYNGPLPGAKGVKNNYLNDAYIEINMQAGIIMDHNILDTEIFFGVNNLLNTRYNSSVVTNAAGNRFFEPSPGISIYGGIRMYINNM